MRSIARRSKIFEIGDVVRVPFPFVEREEMKARPALIVSRPVGPGGTLLWSLMITGADHSSWAGDIPTGPDHLDFGLPVPCLIRTAKIATLQTALIERLLGRLSAPLMRQVTSELRTSLAWS